MAYCRLYGYQYYQSSHDACPIGNECTINNVGACEGTFSFNLNINFKRYINTFSFSKGSYCVYCPSNGTLPCRIVEGYSQSNCSSGIACEFPDGTVEFGLSAEECRYGKRERVLFFICSFHLIISLQNEICKVHNRLCGKELSISQQSEWSMCE